MFGHRRCLVLAMKGPISMVARVPGRRAPDTAVVPDDHSHLHLCSRALHPQWEQTRVLILEMEWTEIRLEVAAGLSTTTHAAVFGHS